MQERKEKKTLGISPDVENGSILCRGWSRGWKHSNGPRVLMRPIYWVVMDLFVAQAPPPVSKEYWGLSSIHFLLPWPFILIREWSPPQRHTQNNWHCVLWGHTNIPLVLIPLVRWQCVKRLPLSTELKVYYCFRLQQKLGELVNYISCSFFFQAWQDNWCVLWTSYWLQLAYILFIFPLLSVRSRGMPVVCF